VISDSRTVFLLFLTRRTQVRVRLARRARVAGVRGAGRVHHVLQLPGSIRLCWHIVPEVFRGLVLLRRHRAGQPEPGPVLGACLRHVLRSPAQGGRTGRHRARAGVHPGHGPRRGHKPLLGNAVVASRQVLLGRLVGRVRCVHMAVHGGRAGGRRLSVLRQRAGSDGRLQPGHVSVQRAGPRLRAHRPAAGGGRGRGEPSRPPVAGRARGSPGPHFRRLWAAGGPPQPGVRDGSVAQVAVQRGPHHHGRVPHHRAVGSRPGRPAVRPRGRRAHGRTRGRDTPVPDTTVVFLLHGRPVVQPGTCLKRLHRRY